MVLPSALGELGFHDERGIKSPVSRGASGFSMLNVTEGYIPTAGSTFEPRFASNFRRPSRGKRNEHLSTVTHAR